MAFDYGTRRIGVAIGHPHIGRGRGIDVVQVRNGKADFDTIGKLVNTWQPAQAVIGVPGPQRAPNSPIRKQIVQFGSQFADRFKMPVYYVDETLSTEESNHRMHRDAKRIPRSKKTAMRNMESAAIILETYFSQTAQ